MFHNSSFLAIASILTLSLAGAILILKHEERLPGTPQWQKVLMDLLLLMVPFMSLAAHYFFWRSVLRAYRNIDTSKEVLRGVWSAKL